MNMRRTVWMLLVSALLWLPSGSQALAPMLAMLGKSILRDMITSSLKSSLLDSLNGMGCKGVALANALTTLDGVKGGGAGLARGMVGMQGMPSLATLPPGMAEAMARMLPSGTKPGGLDGEQSALIAQLMGGLGAPLSPPETLAVIDEMSEIGMLPKAANAELKECMVLLPQAASTMGMAFGMLKPMLPMLRDARTQMHALSPAEQDELAASLAEELDQVPASERKAMLAELGSGMFPPRVVANLNKRYGGK